MCLILITDDENIELDCIIYLIKKYNFDLEIITASDGREALNYIENKKIDILLTDIKMPFLDGLELSKKAVLLQPDLKIIIFSGFNEFEYAKEAILIGVKDYLLKPVNPAEFQEIMQKVINEVGLLKRKEERKQLSNQFIKEHLLLNLINGVPVNIIKKQAKGFTSLEFIQNYSNMLLLEFNKNFFFETDTTYLKELSRVLPYSYDYVNLNPMQSIFLVYKKEPGPLNDSEVIKTAGEIYEYFSLTYNVTCHIAVSKKIENNDLASEYNNLEHLMENKFFLPDCHVFYENFNEDYNEKIQLDSNLFEIITNDIILRDFSRLRFHINLIIQKLKSSRGLSLIYAKYILSNILKTLYQDIDYLDLNGQIEKIYLTNNLDEADTILTDLVNKFESSDIKVYKYENKVATVKQYIYDHYDQDLSLNELASLVYINPDYLCRIFKKETGYGLIKFIKNYRMSEAKRLLEKTHMKINDISKKVGYRNVSYFCQSFREFYSISPEKYRQKDGDINENF
ncbi:response regulator transcription factor [Anaerocolumna sp. MB42-C2]|uniref:response regulator transcription factor n=1 Tax=Anaerocolumna sp. MB42-C2 TaxID=3070997 RepID=UPI0027DF9274|nr:response regulator [Anaerocolumna sp. MB42-C2]WMJ86480.1 response regulator [Anaerocolumna sp. MB42-C2]